MGLSGQIPGISSSKPRPRTHKNRPALLGNCMSTTRKPPLVVGCIFILLASSVRVQAEPYRFQTSSRNIFCQIDPRGLSCDLIITPGSRGGIQCQPTDCNELRFFLPQIGKAFALQRTDSMAFFTKNTILPRTRLISGAIRCTFLKESLLCTNLSGGSLSLKQSGYELNIKSHP